MPETPTPAQDLAALDRVTELARTEVVGLPEAEIVRRGLKWLRQQVVNAGQDRRIGEQADHLFRQTDFDWETATHAQRGAAIRCALALAGFEPAPSPSPSSEGESRASETYGFSAREGILAEVAACDGRSDFSAPYQVRDEATEVAHVRQVNDDGVPVLSRADLIRAAALLVTAVERMDGDR